MSDDTADDAPQHPDFKGLTFERGQLALAYMTALLDTDVSAGASALVAGIWRTRRDDLASGLTMLLAHLITESSAARGQTVDEYLQELGAQAAWAERFENDE